MQHPTHTSYFDTLEGPVSIAALLEHNRALYGGFKMEDEPKEEEPGDETPPEGDAEKEKESAEEKPAEGAEKDDDKDKQLSHEDALAALAKVRREAAEQRTKRREIEERFKDAKTPEEFEALRNELTKSHTDEARTLLVENVSLSHGLPPELADALKGETREELDAHALVLKKFAPEAEPEKDPSRLKGGLTPDDDEDGSFDPRAIAKKNRSRRH